MQLSETKAIYEEKYRKVVLQIFKKKKRKKEKGRRKRGIT